MRVRPSIMLHDRMEVVQPGEANGNHMIVRLKLPSGLEILGLPTENFYGGDWDLGRDDDDVLRGGALLALHHIELDLLALGQRLESTGLNGRVMNEAVLLSVLSGEEPEALVVVEPLDGAFRTHNRLLESGVVC